MDKEKRKALINAYKSKLAVGGIYCIQCSGNGRRWIKSTYDMEGSKGRFMFAVNAKLCPEPCMQREWMEYGIDSFSFLCLEELKMGETQTESEFHNDVIALYEMWLEKETEKEGNQNGSESEYQTIS